MATHSKCSCSDNSRKLRKRFGINGGWGNSNGIRLVWVRAANHRHDRFTCYVSPPIDPFAPSPNTNPTTGFYQCTWSRNSQITTSFKRRFLQRQEVGLILRGPDNRYSCIQSRARENSRESERALGSGIRGKKSGKPKIGEGSGKRRTIFTNIVFSEHIISPPPFFYLRFLRSQKPIIRVNLGGFCRSNLSCRPDMRRVR